MLAFMRAKNSCWGNIGEQRSISLEAEIGLNEPKVDLLDIFWLFFNIFFLLSDQMLSNG